MVVTFQMSTKCDTFVSWCKVSRNTEFCIGENILFVWVEIFFCLFALQWPILRSPTTPLKSLSSTATNVGSLVKVKCSVFKPDTSTSNASPAKVKPWYSSLRKDSICAKVPGITHGRLRFLPSTHCKYSLCSVPKGFEGGKGKEWWWYLGKFYIFVVFGLSAFSRVWKFFFKLLIATTLFHWGSYEN